MTDTKSFSPELFEPDRVAYVQEMDVYLQRLKGMNKTDAVDLAHRNLVQCGILQENGEFTERYR